MSRRIRGFGTFAVIAFVLFGGQMLPQARAYAADWPQWRGPNREGICQETGLLKTWPQGGPKLLWEINGLGPGYSSMTIVKGRLYTMGDVAVITSLKLRLYAPGDVAVEQAGSKNPLQCVLAYDLSTHQMLWAAPVGPPHSDGGPRCTPTVDDGSIYAIGTSGDVVCIDAATGKVLWKKNLQKDFDGQNPEWKYSESPLIDGDRLVCTPGGRGEAMVELDKKDTYPWRVKSVRPRAVMVALDKKTGEPIWKCSMPDIGSKGKDQAGYSSIVISDACGIKQYVQLTNKGVIGVAAKDGRFLWGYNKIANNVANIPTPVVHGDYVFCSTAYGTGSALLKLTAAGDAVKAEEVYFLNDSTFQNHHGGFVRLGDYIYGGHGHNAGKPTCIELKTGKILWQQDQPGKGTGSVLYADGRLYFRYEDNVMALVEATPERYNLISTFALPKRKGMDGPGWPHVVISDGKLYVRHADVLMVFDIKEKS